MASGVGAAAAIQADRRAKASHLAYVDALRVLLIILVIAHHSVEPYTTRNPPEWVLPAAPLPHMGVFLWVNACFFMGLFFFLGGYFMPLACARRRPSGLARERLRRLGIPILLGLLVIIPLEGWFRYRATGLPPMGYRDYFTNDFLGIGKRPAWWPADRHWPEVNLGHLWFLQHLLIYGLLFALWRRLVPSVEGVPSRAAPPGNVAIVGYALALAIATAGIRQWYPINRWMAFLGFIQMEPAHLPQYVSLFVIGLIAGPRRWIETMPRRRGLGWLGVGVALAAVAYIQAARASSGGVGGGDGVGAGINGWFLCTYESFICVGFCVGLPVALRELAIGEGRLWRTLGDNVLAAYVFHFPIVMLMLWLLIGSGLPPWLRMVATVATAAAITFLFTNYVVLRIPGSRRVF